jgi:selenocysteine lyase/cysteine desulfurase
MHYLKGAANVSRSGSPPVGLGAAVDYLQGIAMENVARYEHELLIHATELLNRILDCV